MYVRRPARLRSRGTMCPSFVSEWPSGRAQGAPDAGRTRKPCVQKEVHFAHASKTGQPKQPALPAQWCYGLYAPSPVSGLFSHRRPQGSAPRELDPSVGGSGPRDFAVHIGTRFVLRADVSIASRTNVRDDASAPLRERGMAYINHDFQKYGRGIFLPDGLDISRTIFR